jgi:hypothetical protein
VRLPNVDDPLLDQCITTLNGILEKYALSSAHATVLWQLIERAASTWLAQDRQLPAMTEAHDVIPWVTKRVELNAGNQDDLQQYVDCLEQLRSRYRMEEHDKIALHTAHMLFIAGVLLEHGKITDEVVRVQWIK